jgi:glycosyltransferase involved in cell wall biosynthesis
VIVNLIQPAMPEYRLPFMIELSHRLDGGLRVWAPEKSGLQDSHAELVRNGVDFTPAPVRRCGPFFFQWNAIKAAACADVIVLSLNIRHLDLLPAVLLARLRGCGVVFWGHGRSPRIGTWATRIRDRMAALGHSYILYNEREAQALRERGRFTGAIAVAHNTLDTERIRRIRNRLPADGRPAGEPRIAFISRLYDQKRVDLLIRAIHAVSASSGTAVGLDVIGDGPSRASLRDLVRALGLDDQVRFHGAMHDEAAIAAILRGCAAFCMPEACGLSIIHALAYGLPVIVNDDYRSNGPEYEAVVAGANGLTFPRGDVEALARVIERVVSDRPLRQRLASGAEASIADGHLSIASMVASFGEAVRSTHHRTRRHRRAARARQ